ncbi:hypothetical protein EH223_16085 [candidate division KSB1 bacterium]|nr:hypothetical protein [candidate division KSB1 bacterium]RQW01214.1 MAG: hypothetical protein EH223_16085 [candidate division KSB1 bacterium]
MKKITTIVLFAILMLTTGYAKDWRWQVGPNLSFTYPFEKYANAQTLGEGLGAKIIYNLGYNEWLNPRLDFIYLSYGSDRNSLPGNPYYVVETRNESFQLSTGLHIAKPKGIVRYYLAPLAGVFNYRSVVSDQSLYLYTGYQYSDTRGSQWKWGARVQGGFLFDIGLGPLLDIGFTYQRIFNIETQRDDGSSYRADAEDFMLSLGILIFAK